MTSADITCVNLGIFGQPCPMPDCNEDGMVTSADITCVILEIFNEPRCFTIEEIAGLDCPAEAVLDVCEPYFCGGCTSDFFCFDFLFPIMFTGCQATGCNTIACNEADDITVNGLPSGTTEFEGEPVPFTCSLF